MENMKKVITVLALFLSLLGAVSFADQADAAIFTRVAYRGGKKLNIWDRSGAGKKIVGQVKSGQKLTLKATATYKGNLWYELKNNTWIMAANTVTTNKYASILKAAKQNKVVSLANKQVGKAYVWGATGPYSFDCSGLTQYVYKKTIGTYLPHYSVTQRYYGKAVSTKKLQKGDLLFFGSKSAPNHVGIYVGGGKFVHASSPTVGVIKSYVSSRKSSVFYPSSARRLI